MNTTTSENKIKPGYKKTPVGIIPEDWKVKRIGSISTTFSGGTPRTGVKEYYENGTIPFIKSGEIFQESTNQKITDLGLKESSAKLIEKGDLLYALYGANSGEVSISKQDGAINQAVLCIKSKMNNKYLEENLTYSHQRIISKYLQGGQGNLSAKILKSVQLPIPPLPEQKAIADCLTTWDKGIEKLTALIQSKKEQKKGLMQQLLTGEKRLDGFTEEWEEVKFKDLFKRVNSKKNQITSKEYIESGVYPVVDQGKVKIVGYSNQKNKLYTNVPVIVFGDHTREVKFIDFDFIIGADGTQLLKNKDDDDIIYLYYLLKNTHVVNLGYSRHMRVLITKKFIIPNPKEQSAIAEVLSTADKEIELLEKKLNQFKTQKKGLMQVLLTGQKRLIN